MELRTYTVMKVLQRLPFAHEVDADKPLCNFAALLCLQTEVGRRFSESVGTETQVPKEAAKTVGLDDRQEAQGGQVG